MSLNEKENKFNALKAELKKSSNKLMDIINQSTGDEVKKLNSLLDTVELYTDYCTEVINNSALPLTRSINERAEQIEKFCKVIEKLNT